MDLIASLHAALLIGYGLAAVAVTIEVARLGFLIVRAAHFGHSPVLTKRATHQTTLLVVIVCMAWLNVALGLTPTPATVVLLAAMFLLLRSIKDPAIIVRADNGNQFHVPPTWPPVPFGASDGY